MDAEHAIGRFGMHRVNRSHSLNLVVLLERVYVRNRRQIEISVCYLAI